MRALVCVAVVLGAAGVARAECGRSATPRWMSHHSLVMLLNPTGAEYNGRLGLCVPLYDDDDPAFAANHLEIGVSTYLSPVYVVPGVYAQIAPVSFFYLRAEISGITIWPLPLEGAGYYVRSGYDAGWDGVDLPADAGTTASGWTARLRATFRGRVDLSDELELVLSLNPWLEVNVLDRGAYWANLRDDLISAQGDLVFAHEGVLMLGLVLPGGPALRLGAFSSLRNVPASGYVGHRFGPLAMASIPWPDEMVESVDVFIRLGLYTHHRFRTWQVSTMAGVGVDLDMGGL